MPNPLKFKIENKGESAEIFMYDEVGSIVDGSGGRQESGG